MCKVYPKDVLSNYVVSSLACAEQMFYFRRNLAASLSYQSFINFAFNVGEFTRH
jgi:hypothetical protein